MTRHCLNCGALIEDLSCLSCELGEVAAAALLRRRLLNRFAVFLLGAVAFLPAAAYYPPLELDLMLIFLGVLFFTGLALAIWLDRRARRLQELEVAKRTFFALVPVPWLLAALIFANGAFDSSPAANHRVPVVAKSAMPGLLRSNRLVVRSWRSPSVVERVSVSRDDYGRFEIGDSVVVRTGGGLLGIPWVRGVYRE